MNAFAHPLTATRRGAIVGLGGLKTSEVNTSGSRPVSLRLFLRLDSVRAFPLWREGEEYNTRKGNNSARSLSCVSLSGFQPPATSAVLKSLAVGVLQRRHKGLIMTNALIPSEISVSDLDTALDNEPRILDVRLGKRLGMARPTNIRKIVDDNRAELERYGAVCTNRVQTSRRGGRPATAYYLNEAQALLLCMFSRTDNAADVRQEVISVYMAYRRGPTAPVAAPAVEDVPKAMCLEVRSKATYPFPAIDHRSTVTLELTREMVSGGLYAIYEPGAPGNMGYYQVQTSHSGKVGLYRMIWCDEKSPDEISLIGRVVAVNHAPTHELASRLFGSGGREG